jgi:hypothetical protein
MKYSRIICFLLFINLNGIARAEVPFPSIDESDLPDAHFKTPKTYTEASLFGYMNGGAELYREYGIDGAWINEIRFMGGEYTAEIYRMSGPEEAFGIFSVSRYRCSSAPAISRFTCQTTYQLQICSGPFYINIVNQAGKTTDSIASLRIGEAIVKKIKDKPADISGFLPDISPEIINREAILAKGILGIMNGAPDVAGFFGETSDYCAVILKQDKETLLSVRFLSSEAMDAFVSHHIKTAEMIPAEIITKISDRHLLISIRE